MTAPKTRAPELEGIITINAGMHSGISPRLIPPNQCAFMINMTCRNSLLRTRPNYRKVPLVYADEDVEENATTKQFQCASFYQAYGNNESVLIASIGGRIFRYLVGTTNAVQDVSLAGDLNNQVATQAWMWQSEDFLIINDGQKYPLFWDGAGLSRSLGQAGNQLPVGKMGCYVQGRNWMVLPDGRSFMAGNLVYSMGFTDGYGGRKAVLYTTENEFLSGGGSFAVPISAGAITAMTSVSIPDTSLGQGPLSVLTRKSVYNVQTPIDREEWAATTYPLMTIGLPDYGSLSQNATVTVNGDIWYRSIDGIRSYRIARRDMATNYVQTPLSVEVEKILNFDQPNLLGYSSAVVFDNRLLITCSPYNVQNHGVAHQGTIALDFNNISNLTTRSDPCYDGLWTGLPILQYVKGTFNGVERCFAFALDADNNICLYELFADGETKFDYNGTEDISVQSVVETRTFGFKDNGNQLKRLYCADLFCNKLLGNDEVNFDFKYRSDQDPGWQDWHSFSLCAPASKCALEPCEVPSNVQAQYRTFLRLPQPNDDCNPITNRLYRTGYEFQVRMQWTGYHELNRLMVWASPTEDTIISGCPTTETCQVLSACDLSWFDYHIEG